MTNEEDLASLYRRLMAGDLTLYAWGAVRHFAFYDWCLPWPYAAVFDSSPAKYGVTLQGIPVLPPERLLELDPSRTVIIVLPPDSAHVAAIVRQIEAFGAFPIIPFSGAGNIARIIRAENAPSGEKLYPLISNFEAFRDRNLIFLDRLLEAGAGETPQNILSSRLGAMMPRQHCRERNPHRACLFIGQLNLGGAERQIVALAQGLKSRGWDVMLIAESPEPAESREYAAALQAAGVEYRIVGAASIAAPMDKLSEIMNMPEASVEVLWHLPIFALLIVVAYLDLLWEVEPDLVVSYLDVPNVTAGIAAVLAGVPKILLSGRNYNPSRFPHFYSYRHEDCRLLYKALVQIDRVRLTTNAHLCSADYAEWLGIDPERVATVPNCLSPHATEPPTPEEVALCRSRYGLEEGRDVLLGIFRLSPEKDPFLFLDVVERLMESRPGLRAIHCGGGALAEDFSAEIWRRGLQEKVIVAGPVERPAALMACSTLLLHTARHEGMPNILLEAQSLGLPVVATLAGGARECLAPEFLPLAREPGDSSGLVESCTRLLDDRSYRAALADRLPSEMHGRFSVERLVAATLSAAGIDAGHRDE